MERNPKPVAFVLEAPPSQWMEFGPGCASWPLSLPSWKGWSPKVRTLFLIRMTPARKTYLPKQSTDDTSLYTWPLASKLTAQVRVTC